VSEVRNDGGVAWLGWLGIALEFVGVVLVGAPDLVPGARRLSLWLGEHGERAAWRVLRLLGFKRTHYASASVGGTASVSGRLTVLKGYAGPDSLEAKVDFLFERDQDQQRAVQGMEHKLIELAEETGRQLEAQREEVETFVREEIAAEDARYRWARVIGALCLVAGLVCYGLAAL
jgi:hypothetical protein